MPCSARFCRARTSNPANLKFQNRADLLQPQVQTHTVLCRTRRPVYCSQQHHRNGEPLQTSTKHTEQRLPGLGRSEHWLFRGCVTVSSLIELSSHHTGDYEVSSDSDYAALLHHSAKEAIHIFSADTLCNSQIKRCGGMQLQSHASFALTTEAD